MSIPADMAAPDGWRGLVSGFGLLATGETVARVMGLISTVIMVRILGPVGFGVVVLGTTLVGWSRLVVDAGTETLAVRDLGRSPGRLRSIAEPLLGLRLAIALGFGVLLATAVAVASTGGDGTALALFSLALPVIALNPRFMAVAVQASGAVAVGNVAGQLVLLAGIVFLVGAGDVERVAILVALGELAYAAVVLGTLGRRGTLLRPRVDVDVWRRTWSEGRALLGYNLARAVIYSADLLLIGVLLGKEEAGQYGVAYRPVLFISGALGLFYVSFLAAHGRGGADAAAALTRRALRTIPPMVLVLAIVLSASAPVTVPAVFGDEFRPAVAVLAVLALTLPIQAVGGVYVRLLIAAGRQETLRRTNVAGAVGNVLANLLVIPVFGMVGAAAVTVITELIVHVALRRSAITEGLAPGRRR